MFAIFLKPPNFFYSINLLCFFNISYLSYLLSKEKEKRHLTYSKLRHVKTRGQFKFTVTVHTSACAGSNSMLVVSFLYVLKFPFNAQIRQYIFIDLCNNWCCNCSAIISALRFINHYNGHNAWIICWCKPYKT